MNVQPKISVIVPVYRVEAYLPQCINSILAQTYTNLEVILIDDGSPDDCGAICDKYAEADDRVIVIHKENRGVSEARNVGINAATGLYLSFIDGDDWADADMIETLYRELAANHADISCCGHYMAYINSNKVLNCLNETLLFNSEQAINQMLANNKYLFRSVWGKLYKKSLFDTIRFPLGLSYGEDAVVTVDVIAGADCIVCVNIPKYYYRQRRESLAHTACISKKLDMIRIYEKILALIKSNYPKTIDSGRAGLLKEKLDALSQIVFSPSYLLMPEYGKILLELRKNYVFMIKSDVFSLKSKIKLTTIKFFSVKFYRLLLILNNRKKRKVLFE